MPDTERIGFRMQLSPGQRAAYQARHDALWPELTDLLRRSGISDYSIFLHEPSGALFGVLRRAPGHAMDRLPGQEIMQRWWRYMADIMQTEPDGAPMSEPLSLVFHMD